MKCLHICNDFLGSKVHENLYKSLAEINVEQTIFHPLRQHKVNKGKNYKKDFDCSIINSQPLKKYHRVFFRTKIKHLYRDLKSSTDANNFDIVHATTLFSDGAVALKLKKEYNTPYIVAVRSTDIDSFLKYRPDLIFLAEEVLNEASKIVFISKTLKEKFLNHKLIKKNRKKLETKSQIISNGIDSYWLDNQSSRKEVIPNKILYVGTFISRKNIDKLINAVLNLNKTGRQCSLTIVGKGGALQDEVEKLAVEHKPTINYIGPIYEKERLKEIYNSHHIFALPSRVETFGLVYLEALSQGLPVLFTKNEGIDGLFNFKIGEKCKTLDVSEISSNLNILLDNYSNYNIDRINFSNFNWNNIAGTYLCIYKSIIND